MDNETPVISIVIPVYNEEEILREAVTDLVHRVSEFAPRHELMLAENGSVDNTIALAQELSDEFPTVSYFSCSQPNYGQALREGIMRARGQFVVCDEIDLCDTDFYQRALHLLEADEADMVVGSKVMPGANDSRPPMRRFATRVINNMLAIAVGFKGTDTHGLKAFRRNIMIPVIERCVVGQDLFASEFVIRASRQGRRVIEIPVDVHEKRRPAVALFKRVPGVLSDMARLTYTIRFKE